MSVVVLTSENFSDVIAEHDLIVVDFWAEWCEPCKNFTKIIETLAPKYSDVLFASVDIEAQKELAEDFNIMSVPAVMILRKQVVVFAESGLLPEAVVIELIEKAKSLTDKDLQA